MDVDPTTTQMLEMAFEQGAILGKSELYGRRKAIEPALGDRWLAPRLEKPSLHFRSARRR
jgi:hypothetical protein